jgi:uncharacterized low-complexity protein
MSKTFSKKPLAVALGTAFAIAGGAAQASVFQATDLGSGYMVAAADAKTADTSKAPEAKCGAACVDAKTKGGMSAADAKAACDKMAAEGKCGDKKHDAGAAPGTAKHAAEGKCGEGNCGEGKKKDK